MLNRPDMEDERVYYIAGNRELTPNATINSPTVFQVSPTISKLQFNHEGTNVFVASKIAFNHSKIVFEQNARSTSKILYEQHLKTLLPQYLKAIINDEKEIKLYVRDYFHNSSVMSKTLNALIFSHGDLAAYKLKSTLMVTS